MFVVIRLMRDLSSVGTAYYSSNLMLFLQNLNKFINFQLQTFRPYGAKTNDFDEIYRLILIKFQAKYTKAP